MSSSFTFVISKLKSIERMYRVVFPEAHADSAGFGNSEGCVHSGKHLILGANRLNGEGD